MVARDREESHDSGQRRSPGAVWQLMASLKAFDQINQIATKDTYNTSMCLPNKTDR